jgi:hypothetical protein
MNNLTHDESDDDGDPVKRSKYRMERLTSPVRTRRFLTYDLEWYPDNYELRIIGVHDGTEYRYYTTIGDFIRGEFTSEQHGCWFFAHAGGLADLPFILEWMLRQGYRYGGMVYNLSGAFSGSAVTSLNVTRKGSHWVMLDSLWLLKDKLRNIAKSMGEEKGGEEAEYDADGKLVMGSVVDPRTGQTIIIPKHHRGFYAPFEELRAYNEKDCWLLWKAIDEFQDFLVEMGGQLQRTYSSCSFSLFRRQYLAEDFDIYALVNDEAEEAYVASRVEVFRRDCRNGKCYDINSSFPYSMTWTLPGKLRRTTNTFPEDERTPFLAQCEVEVQDNQDLPPLPYRLDGRVFFPTGRWPKPTWFTGIDLQLLERTGGKILKVHKVLEFYPWHDLAKFANDLFTLRKQAKLGCSARPEAMTTCGEVCREGLFCQWKTEPNIFRALLLKYVLNGGYGKLAEGELKQGLIINPPPGKVPPREQMYVPGAFVVERRTIVRHRHVPAAAYITAYSRQWIYDYLAYLSTRYYCDTDSFVCDADQHIPAKWVGENLGQIKLEREVEEGVFIAPKVYRMDKLIKAKGFPRLTMQQWVDLIDYKEIEIERMGRIKELYTIGQIAPQDIKIHKKLSRFSTPKRYTYYNEPGHEDGTTRPWTITELHERLIGDGI